MGQLRLFAIQVLHRRVGARLGPLPPPLSPRPALAQPQPPSPSPLPSVLYCLLKAELYTRRTASLENCCITRVSRCRLLCSTQHKNRTLPWTTPGAHVRMRSRYLRTALLLLGVGILRPSAHMRPRASRSTAPARSTLISVRGANAAPPQSPCWRCRRRRYRHPSLAPSARAALRR